MATSEYEKRQTTFEVINIPSNITFRHKWVINDLMAMVDGFKWVSPMFSRTEIQWCLKLKIGNFNDETHYDFQLIYTSKEVLSMITNCTFNLLPNSLPIGETRTWQIPIQFESEKYTDCVRISRNELFAPGRFYTHRGQVTVSCQINVQQISTMYAMPNDTLDDHLELIFENRKYTDVTLCASGK